MLFNVERKESGELRGYLVPDGYSATASICVADEHSVIFRGNCDQFIEDIVASGRHENGMVGFVVDGTKIDGLEGRNEIQIFDEDTGLLLYRRREHGKIARQRVFQLVTSMVGEKIQIFNMEGAFDYHMEGMEYLGQETIFQMFHLRNYDSMYFDGRINMKRFEKFLEEDIVSIVYVPDPFLNLAVTLDRMVSDGDRLAEQLPERDLVSLSPALDYVSKAAGADRRRLVKHLKTAPKAVLKSLESPLTAQLANALPGEVADRTSIPRALDVLSQFNIVLQDSDRDTIGPDAAAALQIPESAISLPEISDGVLELAEELRQVGALHTVLENDIILFRYFADACRQVGAAEA